MPNISQPLVSKKYMPEATKMMFFYMFGKQDVRLQRFLVSDFTGILYKWSKTNFRGKKIQKLDVTENFSILKLRRIGWTLMEQDALIIILEISRRHQFSDIPLTSRQTCNFHLGCLPLWFVILLCKSTNMRHRA